VPASPSWVSRPDPRRCSATLAAVRRSDQASSGCRWKSRRNATSSPRAACTASADSLARGFYLERRHTIPLVVRGARLLRIVATAAIAAAVVVAVAYIGSREATRVEPGDPAPDLELPSVGGAAVARLSDYRGRPVLLVMFHSAAPFSQQEMPDLERLHRALLRKGLVVLGVDVDADPNDRERFLRDNVVTFIVLEDPGGREVRKAYEARRFPQRYLIDAGGVVRQVWLRPVDWSSREVLGQIQALLPGVKQPS